jgi:signal transduction histidine kinase
MSLARLKLATVVLPLAFILVVQGTAMLVLMPGLGLAYGHAVAMAVIAAGVVLFSAAVFRALDRMQIAAAIRARRSESRVSGEEEARALYELGLQIVSLQSTDATLRSIVEHAREMLGGETAVLCRADGTGRGATLASSSGPPEAFRGPQAQPRPQPSSAHAAGQGASARCSLRPEAQCPELYEEYCVSHLSAPLVGGPSVIGALCVSSRTPDGFNAQQGHLLGRLADMAAIAISNARLLEGERNLAVLEERGRLARDMHDSLAQVLGYIHLKAQAAQHTLSQQDVVGAGEELNEVASLAHEAYVDVRETIEGLRHTGSPSAGIIATLRQCLQKFSEQSGVRVELEVDESAVPQFTPEAEAQIARVVKEALTNVRKHANADTVWLRVCGRGPDFIICIEDNGRGFEPALVQRRGGQGLGLQIMRERIDRLGGRFSVDSGAECGTRIRICFPIGERAEQ